MVWRHGHRKPNNGSFKTTEQRDARVQTYGLDCVYRWSSVSPAPVTRTLWVLIQNDARRADYLDRGFTPHLLDISKQGLRAKFMRPVFPVCAIS